MTIPTERQVLAAIKAMDRARDALAPLMHHDDTRDIVQRVRRDLAEYASYLENAIWWRKKERA